MYKAPTYKGLKVRKAPNHVLFVLTTQQSNHPTWLGRLCGKGFYEDIAEFIGVDRIWRELPSYNKISPALSVQLRAFWTALRHRCED